MSKRKQSPTPGHDSAASGSNGGARPAPTSAAAERAARHFETEAAHELAQAEPPAIPEAAKIQKAAEAVLNELEAGKDPKQGEVEAPELYVSDDFAPASWPEIIALLLARVYGAVGAAVAAPAASAENEPEPAAVKKVLALAEAEKKRLGRAIDGKRLRKKAMLKLRSIIFAGRSVSQSRSPWKAELKTLITLIEGLGESAPAAVRLMVPRLRRVLKKLEALPAASSGHAKVATERPEQLDRAVYALDLALNDFLSWAAPTATDRRLGTFTRLLDGHRKSEAPADQNADQAQQPPTGGDTPAPDAQAAPQPPAPAAPAAPQPAPATTTPTATPARKGKAIARAAKKAKTKAALAKRKK